MHRCYAGIDAAIAAGFDQIKLNAVLMRGRNEDQLLPLIEFAAARNLLLRFIELMPVSTTEVLSESNFMSVTEAKRLVESAYGSLIPETEFRTNGPATYYQIPGRAQTHRFHRCDDEHAFLRELQQAAAHVRWKVAPMSWQLFGV